MSNKENLLSEKDKKEILYKNVYSVIKDISQISHKVIEEFYNDYDPLYYKRTFGMKNLFKTWLWINTKENGSSYARIVFLYSSVYLTTQHNSNVDVFKYDFIMGYHGGQYLGANHIYENPNKMKPSPWEQIKNYVLTNYPGAIVGSPKSIKKGGK